MFKAMIAGRIEKRPIVLYLKPNTLYIKASEKEVERRICARTHGCIIR